MSSCVFISIRIKGPSDIVANVLDYDIIVSSNLSRSLTFTFGLIPLGKVWIPSFLPSYGLNSIITILLQE